MGHTLKRWVRGAALLPAVALTGALAYAQEAPDLEARIAALEDSATASAYIDNSYLFLLMGMVVMFMAAGFCMLEVGLVRAKNASMQAMKNVAIYALAGLVTWLCGYHMIYPADGHWLVENWVSMPVIWSHGALETDNGGYAAGSDWFFQMVFVATAASIVSGTVAERVKLLPFLIFTMFLCGVIYPIQCSWVWGGGWLSQMGFQDFAGSTLVHSTGGWAALIGAILIGPRVGKYFGKQVNPMPGSNIPLAALGTFILWLGWFGFNGGSQLAAGTITDINSVSQIFVNTNMGAVGGTVSAMIVTTVLYRKLDATMVFNGALAGLVSITASPLEPSVGLATLVGAAGGVLAVLTVPVLDKLKIDDVVGAIPVHLVCGIWGTLAVAFSHRADIGTEDAPHVLSFAEQLMVQATGVVAIGIFVMLISLVGWLILRFTLGLRATEEEELMGMDLAEVGLEAYPEFTNG
ncbi:MAG TPA: ammonium transporter [Hyphomonas sp.]|nr:ammonium transporter [Hyphomonas sp.]MCA8905256.1 ammonium transporter [Hyphomonas sp.]MCB9961932.1 ammonium transporter [Hyphomonas sp.]MCB9970926.1 ammonium transporter [Hyphomonas sp.]HPE49146.1 ammonium transporter [Hyphomonas sp.]